MYGLLLIYLIFNILFKRLEAFNKMQAVKSIGCLMIHEGFILRWRVVRINSVAISSANDTGKVARVWKEQPVQSDHDIFKDKAYICYNQLQTCEA